jgi:DNA polymerase I
MSFWPLDIYYHEVPGGTEVHIWGRDEHGNLEHYTDDSLHPHFLSNLDIVDGPELKEKLKVYRKRQGKDETYWEFRLTHPRDVTQYRDVQVGGDVQVHECDILFSEVYTYWRRLGISAWNSLNGSDQWEPLDGREPPELSIMGLDLECYNPKGQADPDVDPIALIGIDPKECLVLDGDIHNRDDRADLLERFAARVRRDDPDIIATYAGTRFDLPYLVRQAEVLDVDLFIGRDGSRPRQTQYGGWQINGRAHLDLYGWAKQTLPHVKPLTLKNVAREYLKMPKEEVIELEGGKRIAELWDKGYIDQLVQYNLSDVNITYKLCKQVLPFTIALSSLTGLPIKHVYENKGKRTPPNQIDHFLMKMAVESQEVVPRKPSLKHEPFKGAVVIEPRPGVYRDVHVIDFKSMYPHILMKLFPDTMLARGCRQLFAMREQYPKEGKTEPMNYALKILMNVSWGYFGWDGARWSDFDKAATITAMGRAIVSNTADFARRHHFIVIYGDTDSCFFLETGDSDISPEAFRKEVQDHYRMPVEIDMLLKLFFGQTRRQDKGRKKAYFAWDQKRKLIAKGYETVKGDYCDIARIPQKYIAGIVLQTDDPYQAVRYAHNVLTKIKDKAFPKESFIIRKKTNEDDYKIRTPQGTVAEKIGAKKGDVVEYVIARGDGQLWEKALPFQDLDKYDQIDLDWYIRKQFLPVAMRVLGFFGVAEDEILEGSKTINIADFA